jgi:hypothetical protein
MSITQKKTEMTLLLDAAFEDLDAASDEQLLRELQEDGLDPQVVAQEMKVAMHEAVAAALRQRMVLARSAARVSAEKEGAAKSRPALDALKKIVQSVLGSNPEVGLAFREAKRQTDADYITLYDDLVATGAIKRDDDVL